MKFKKLIILASLSLFFLACDFSYDNPAEAEDDTDQDTDTPSEMPVDNCIDNLCDNGSCASETTGYSCECSAGWTGDYCDVDIDECAGTPCVNGTCQDELADYSCECTLGWDGKNCDVNVDDCTPNPCVNGTCFDGVNGYTCDCSQGWEGDECNEDINECARELDNCTAGFDCENNNGGYDCTNIDECAEHACLNDSTCIDGIDEYTCDCASGWDGDYCELDIDECTLGTHNCAAGYTCENTIGDRICHECQLDSESCDPTSECVVLPTGRACVDIDECSLPGHGCDYFNGTCTNTPGGHVCGCPDGWSVDNDLNLAESKCIEDFDAVELSVAGERACALKKDGKVVCWGAGVGASAFPLEGTFVHISLGVTYSCGVRIDGTVACWGGAFLTSPYAYGETGDYLSFGIGYRHGCGLLTDGTLRCWGLGYEDASSTPSGVFTQLSVGDGHNCGVTNDNSLTCWGVDDFGETVAPNGSFMQAAAGKDHSCGLLVDGTISCWGLNSSGQLAAPSGHFTQIEAGFHHNCAIDSDNKLTCWGENSEGQASPPDVEFSSVTLGDTHSCGTRLDGSVVCWGAEFEGRFNVPLQGPFEDIHARQRALCVKKVGGQTICLEDTALSSEIENATPFGPFKQVRYGRNDKNSCGLREDSTLICWNKEGEQTFLPPGEFERIAYADNICGIKKDSSLVCWDDQSVRYSPSFAIETFAEGWGNCHCAITTNGSLECWGDSSYYCSDDGSFEQVFYSQHQTACGVDEGEIRCWRIDSSHPSSMANIPEGPFRQVANGSDTGCAIALDDTIECFGDDLFGGVGPVIPPVGTFSKIVELRGMQEFCGLTTDGELRCWGGRVR